MRFTPTARVCKKNQELSHKMALELVGLKTFHIPKEECEKRIYGLKEYLNHVPNEDQGLKRDWYYGALATAYSYFLSEIFDWKVGELIFKEHDPYDDVSIVVSQKEEYSLYAIGIVVKEHEKNNNLMIDMYEKIKHGTLPPSAPGKLLRLHAFFYEDIANKVYTPFLPLTEKQMEDWKDAARKGAHLFDIELDENAMPSSGECEVLMQKIENLILLRRGELEKNRDEAFLIAMSALYGQCLQMKKSFILAETLITPFRKFKGMPILHSLSRRHWLCPYSAINDKFLFNDWTDKVTLKNFYHYIHSNDLYQSKTYSPDEIRIGQSFGWINTSEPNKNTNS
jgi:hypothetical protein